MTLILLKAGSTLPSIQTSHGDFEQMFMRVMGIEPEAVSVVELDKTDHYPDPASVDGVLIMGSASMVTDGHSWIETSSAWLRQVVGAGIPTLGVCFGHQLLAHAFGGEVADNPKGLEIGTVPLQMQGDYPQDPLLGELPPQLLAHVTHSQSVVRLPEGVMPLASSELEPHHAFRLAPNAWGVQFHPEFDEAVISGYLENRRGALGDDRYQALRQSVTPTPHSSALLQRFWQIVVSRTDTS